MPKVKLTEKKLREIISAALNESAPSGDVALTDEDKLQPMVFTAAMQQDQQISALIDALTQFADSDVLAIVNKKTFPSPKEMVEYFRQNTTTTGDINDQWTPTAATQTYYLNVYLRLKIIDALNTATNKDSERFAYIMPDVIFRRDRISPKEIETLDVAKKFFNVSNELAFNTPQFFQKLEDFVFVKSISDPGNGWAVPEGSSLADINPARNGTFVEKSVGESALARVKAAANDYVANLEKLYSQFDTDFVETFFCGPLINPGIWKRYVNDPSHPLTTPWRASYTVLNIASNAASVSGGTLALYTKLIDYVKTGSSYQPGETLAQQDPWLPSGVFKLSDILQESKKILLTQNELRLVINAALLAEAGWLERFEKLKKFVAGTSDVVNPEEVRQTADALTRQGLFSAARAGKYADVLGTITKAFKHVGALDNLKLNKSQYKEIFLKRLKTVAGAGIETTKEQLADLLAEIVVQVQNDPEGLTKVILGLTSNSAELGNNIANIPRPTRDALLRLLSEGGEDLLNGDETVKLAEKYVSIDAAKSVLKRSLADELLQSVKSQTGRSELKYDAATGNFTQTWIDGSSKPPKTFNLSAIDDDASDTLRIGEEGPDAEYFSMEILQKARNYQQNVAAIDAGTIPVEGSPTIASYMVKEALGTNTKGVFESLRGALISPQAAHMRAGVGLADHKEQAEVVAGQLDRLSKPGWFEKLSTLGQEGGPFGKLGKFGRKSYKQDLVKYALWAPIRIPGSIVRMSARSVREALGDTSGLGKFADTIATSGLYSSLLGIAAFNAILGIGKASTPAESNLQTFLRYLDILVPDGALSFGIFQVIADIIAEGVNAAVKSGASEAVKDLINADHSAAQKALADVLKKHYIAITNDGVDPNNFKGLTTDDSLSFSYAQVATKMRQLPIVMLDLLSGCNRASSGDENATQQIQKKSSEAVQIVDTLGATKNLAQSAGNSEWKRLETTRLTALETVIQQLDQGPGAFTTTSTSSVAKFATILTKNYFTTKSIADNALYSTAGGIVSYILGTEGRLAPWGVSGGQDFEEFAMFIMGLIFSDEPATNFANINTRKIDKDELIKINEYLTSVRDAFQKLQTSQRAALEPTPEEAQTAGTDKEAAASP